jgi:hypothetical protein
MDPAHETISHLIDVAVERWHNSPIDDQLSAPEWLGLSREQYAMYVECRWADLVESLGGPKT